MQLTAPHAETDPVTVPEITKVLSEGGAGSDNFGCSVAISGDYAVMCAPGDDDNGLISGSAYILRRTGFNSWQDQTEINDGSSEADESFGASVSISGADAIVGAPDDDTLVGLGSGSAWVFTRTDPNGGGCRDPEIAAWL